MKKLLFSLVAASTVVASLGSFSGNADAAVISLTNANFLDPVNNAGVVDTNALPGGVLNTSFGPAPAPNAAINPNGFVSFFTTPFVSLGSLGTTTIRNSTAGSNSLAQSLVAINLSAAEAALPVQVTYDFAFAGNSSVPGTPDNFRILFVDAGGTNVGPIQNLVGSTSFIQTGLGTLFNIPANTFTAGTDYFLQLVLNENIDGTVNNTAAGFNNVSITTNVPFEFSPALGVLALGGLFGASQLRKQAKRKQAIKIDSVAS
jgi:hypothetical protein